MEEQLLNLIPEEHRSTAKAYATLRIAEELKKLHTLTGDMWTRAVDECRGEMVKIEAIPGLPKA